MARFVGIVATIGALALAGVATHASAQAKIKAPATTSTALDFTDQNAWGPAAGDKSLQWNGKGRWGLKLDFDQPTQRDVQWKDVDAGVAFKINRSLQVSAAVNVGGATSTPPTRLSPDEKPQPKVRLQTTFRF